jgi:hypothetical protein
MRYELLIFWKDKDTVFIDFAHSFLPTFATKNKAGLVILLHSNSAAEKRRDSNEKRAQRSL